MSLSYKSEAEKDIKQRRALAKSCNKRKSTSDKILVNRRKNEVTDNNTTLGVSVFKTGRDKRTRYADIGFKGLVYSPAHSIAKKIQDSLNPDKDEGPGKQSVIGTGGPSIIVRGIIESTTKRGGTKTLIYGVTVWLQSKYVEDIGKGKLHIASICLTKSGLLRWAIRMHKKRIENLIKKT